MHGMSLSSPRGWIFSTCSIYEKLLFLTKEYRYRELSRQTNFEATFQHSGFVLYAGLNKSAHARQITHVFLSVFSVSFYSPSRFLISFILGYACVFFNVPTSFLNWTFVFGHFWCLIPNIIHALYVSQSRIDISNF